MWMMQFMLGLLLVLRSDLVLRRGRQRGLFSVYFSEQGNSLLVFR